MPTMIPSKVPEESSVMVIAEFKNPVDDSEITPITTTWSLSDLDGNIINGREDVVVAPLSTMTFFMSGLDLQIVDQTNNLEQRRLLIATYDSGDGVLPLQDEAIFAVYNLGNVT